MFWYDQWLGIDEKSIMDDIINYNEDNVRFEAIQPVKDKKRQIRRQLAARRKPLRLIAVASVSERRLEKLHSEAYFGEQMDFMGIHIYPII